MKVKVILRAPKSQIPLYMTLNDAKFGGKDVATSLDVVESNEVVEWVNIPQTEENLEVAPQKKLEITADHNQAKSNTKTNSGNERGRIGGSTGDDGEKPSRNSSPFSPTPNDRHKYNVTQLKEVLPIVKAKASEKAGSPESENSSKNLQGLNELESLLSRKLDRDLSSSGVMMGATAAGTKYNGKELKSNLRKKYFKSPNLKGGNSKDLYDFNKKFRSNDDFQEIWDGALTRVEEEASNASENSQDSADELATRKIIENEIENASKIDSIHCDIAKAFKNLTLEPYLCRPSQEGLHSPNVHYGPPFLNELSQKVPLIPTNHYSPKNNSRNMYNLIHCSGDQQIDPVSPGVASSSFPIPIQNPVQAINQGQAAKPTPRLRATHKLDNIHHLQNQYNLQKPNLQIHNSNPIHKTGKEPTLNPNSSNLNVKQSTNNQDSNLTAPHDSGNFKPKLNQHSSSKEEKIDSKSELSSAFSRLNSELSNTNVILCRYLNNGAEPNHIGRGGTNDKITNRLIEDFQNQLAELESLFGKIRSTFQSGNSTSEPKERSFGDVDSWKDHADKAKVGSSVVNQMEPETGKFSNKVPNTDLPLLTEIPNQVKTGAKLIKTNRSSQIEIPFQIFSRPDPGRSSSVPVHEKQLVNQDQVGRNTNDTTIKNVNCSTRYPFLKEIKEFPRNKSLNSNRISNKLPQTKIGLKPNSSLEKINLQPEERGRPKLSEQTNPRGARRDFVAENKSNVIFNATKSSSSLQINQLNKKGTRLSKKSQPNPPNTNFNNHPGPSRTKYFGSFDRNEIYPSLKVGGPISRMNGFCHTHFPCFPSSYHDQYPNNGNRDFINRNYQHFDYGNFIPQQKTSPNYFEFGGISSNNTYDTPRCPYWCNMICRI
ncbi:TPR repeat family protein [Cryptosporidium felis]|nr:TPR repeat family protein [Cryptosporidium felis]